MGFKIVSNETKRNIFKKDVRLDTTRRTAILIRQSRKGADVEHYESRLLQESLLPWVIEVRGDVDDRDTDVFDEGSGVSGTKGIDKRDLLRSLHYGIAQNKYGDLVLARPDRLFRDKHFDKVSTFTQLAEKMRIRVVVPSEEGTTIYDFRKTKDLQRFQQEMQAAYGYLETQMGYMHRARENKKARGYYGGGNLPLPLVLLLDMPKEEQVPVIYEPWKEYALDLFKKFAEYNFEIARMARYIESKPFVFPFMLEKDLLLYKPVTSLCKTASGYTLTNSKGIRHYLSNLLLGGYGYGGKDEDGDTILIENAFDAAIPRELLEPAYAAIKGHYLDGTPFEKSLPARQHRRCTEEEVGAILHGLLSSDQGAVNTFNDDDYPMYTCLKGGYLGMKSRAGLDRQVKPWILRCSELDTIVLDRLIALCEYDKETVNHIRAYFDALSAEDEKILDVLDTAIQKTQTALKKLSKAIVLLTKGENEEEDKELDEKDPIVIEYRKLSSTLRRLHLERKKVAEKGRENPAKNITNFYYIISHLGDEFNKQLPQTQKDIIKRLIKEIKVNAISPHLYTLHITWIQPVASREYDVALLWRSTPIKGEWSGWSEEEEAVLRALYPSSSKLEIMQAIPYKSQAQIRVRASDLNLKRLCKETKPYHHTVTYADLKAAARFAGSIEERAIIWQEVNNMAVNTVRWSPKGESKGESSGQVSASWFIPVDLVSFSYAFKVTDVKEGEMCQPG